VQSRIAYGRIIRAFLRAGWRPPPIHDRGLERLLDDVGRVHHAAKLELSPLQLQILQGIAAGKRYSEIAADLDMNFETVRERQKQTFARLGARNGPHAVAIGFRAGILE
jgi:DNA-binding NarL/FixJ family response regulator